MTSHALTSAAADGSQASHDPSHDETCPFCHTAVPVSASVCSGCGARKSVRGAQSPLGRLFLWVMVFGHLWFFGAAALIGPWLGAESGIRESEVQGCVQLVSRKSPGAPLEERYLTIADVPCRQVANLRAAAATAVDKYRKEYPWATFRAEGAPYTKPLLREATPAEKGQALRKRLGISAAGLMLLVFGTWGANKLWRRLFGRASDPVWIR